MIKKRLGAYLIDSTFIILFAWAFSLQQENIFYWLNKTFLPLNWLYSIISLMGSLTIGWIIGTVFLNSLLMMRHLKGQTYGKQLMKLKTVNINNTKISPIKIILRESLKSIFPFFVAWSAYKLGFPAQDSDNFAVFVLCFSFLLITSSVTKYQAGHDYILKTKVIENENNQK